ncbi:MAG: hypothetical protein SGPRY_014801 [Prymnesium sp.]
MYCSSADVVRVCCSSRVLVAAVMPAEAAERMLAVGQRYSHLSMHDSRDMTLEKLHLHALLPVGLIRTYATAFWGAGVVLRPSSCLHFRSAAEVEACAVTWLELEETPDDVSRTFVVDFSWREETIRQFMAGGGEASTKSGLVKVDFFNDAQQKQPGKQRIISYAFPKS